MSNLHTYTQNHIHTADCSVKKKTLTDNTTLVQRDGEKDVCASLPWNSSKDRAYMNCLPSSYLRTGQSTKNDKSKKGHPHSVFSWRSQWMRVAAEITGAHPRRSPIAVLLLYLCGVLPTKLRMLYFDGYWTPDWTQTLLSLAATFSLWLETLFFLMTWHSLYDPRAPPVA